MLSKVSMHAFGSAKIVSLASFPIFFVLTASRLHTASSLDTYSTVNLNPFHATTMIEKENYPNVISTLSFTSMISFLILILLLYLFWDSSFCCYQLDQTFLELFC